MGARKQMLYYSGKGFGKYRKHRLFIVATGKHKAIAMINEACGSSGVLSRYNFDEEFWEGWEHSIMEQQQVDNAFKVPCVFAVLFGEQPIKVL